MAHSPHELAEEFPDRVEHIHQLKVESRHFRKLFDEYHKVNRAVHRAETTVEPMDSLSKHLLRKRRMHLKDELAQMLA